jgi:hypothetical protein
MVDFEDRVVSNNDQAQGFSVSVLMDLQVRTVQAADGLKT